MRAPLIGLTGRRKTGADLVGNPESLHGLAADWYYADYARGVIAAGGLPVHLPLDVDPTAIIDRLDGILLSGGADVDPSRYDTPAAPETGPTEPERDAFELALLGAASERAMPVLGVCRGIQLINVACGGTLTQHVPEQARYDVPPSARVQTLDLTPGSELAALYGPTVEVNSLHHQTIDQLGHHLRVAAQDASHGIVEGLEHRELPIIAIQWHPEMLSTRDTDPIFRWLVDRAATRADR